MRKWGLNECHVESLIIKLLMGSVKVLITIPVDFGLASVLDMLCSGKESQAYNPTTPVMFSL